MKNIKKLIKKIFLFNPILFVRHILKWKYYDFHFQKDYVRLGRAKNMEYQSYRNKQIYILKKRFKKDIQLIKNKIDKERNEVEHKRTNKIWVCWLQGMENAPQLVQTCYHSIKEHLKGFEIIVITEENYKEYVSFPDYIIEKYNNEEISCALFSDLLRLKLLNSFGGTWIDATVLCTSDNIPEYMVNSDLFMFQTTDNESLICATSTESWFISACSNNPILLLTQELMLKYLEKTTALNDYLIFYDLLEIAIEEYPDEWNKVMPVPRSTAWLLVDNWLKPYNEEVFRHLISFSPFHKLTYRHIPDENKIREDSIYFYIINMYRK